MNHGLAEPAVHWSAPGPILPQDSGMCAIAYGISRLSTFGSVVAFVAGGTLVAWVIGLLIVLRGSEPDER